MTRGTLAIRGRAAARRGYGFVRLDDGRDVFVLRSSVSDVDGGYVPPGRWAALDGRAVSVGSVVTTDRGRDEAPPSAPASFRRPHEGRRLRSGGPGVRGPGFCRFPPMGSGLRNLPPRASGRCQ